MISIFMVRLCAVVSLIAVTACRHTNAADVKHEFGKIALSDLPLNCVQSPTPPEHQELQSYARSVLNHLIEKNKNQFPSEYTSDRFCIEIMPNAYPNATAHSSGQLDIHVGIIAGTANDAQFASVIAHELAHILNFHQAKAKTNLPDDKDYGATVARLKNLHPIFETSRDERTHMSGTRQLIEPLGDGALKAFSNYKLISVAYLEAMPQADVQQGLDDFLAKLRDNSLAPEFLNSSQNHDNRDYWPAVTLLAMARDSRINLMNHIVNPEMKARFNAAEQKIFANIWDGMQIAPELSLLRRAKREYEISKEGPEVANNWIEQEADEIGLEMYLRAGFPPSEMTNFFSNLRKLKDNTESEGGALRGDEVSRLALDLTDCFRGEGIHPALCWRIQDVKNELQKHQLEYESIIADPGVVTLYTGKLDAVKKAYEPFFSSQSAEVTNGPKLKTHWCDPYKPKFCKPYCQEPTTPHDGEGWATEHGASCVIRNSVVDFRI